MRRGLVLVSVLALTLVGCGGGDLTNEQVEAMTDEEALAMLDRQMQKAAEDLGQEGAVSRYGDALMGSVEGDGDTLQVILHSDGYSYPEYLE